MEAQLVNIKLKYNVDVNFSKSGKSNVMKLHQLYFCGQKSVLLFLCVCVLLLTENVFYNLSSISPDLYEIT